LADLAELYSTTKHGVHGGGAPELHAPRTLAPLHKKFKATFSEILLLHSKQRENEQIIHPENIFYNVHIVCTYPTTLVHMYRPAQESNTIAKHNNLTYKKR
jgi:hypothetical protein